MEVKLFRGILPTRFLVSTGTVSFIQSLRSIILYLSKNMFAIEGIVVDDDITYWTKIFKKKTRKLPMSNSLPMVFRGSTYMQTKNENIPNLDGIINK